MLLKFCSRLLTCGVLATCLGGPVFGATINVTGGGANLQTAIDAAAATDTLLVNDDLTYNPILLNKSLTIRAGAGFHPVLASNPAVKPSNEVLFVFDGGRNATWDGIDIVQDDIGGDPGHNVVFVANNADPSTFTLMNCKIWINRPGDNIDARLATFGDRAHAVNVTFTRNDNNGNPLVLLADKGGNTTLDNCTVGPNMDGTAILNVANPAGQITNLNNCLITGIKPANNFGYLVADRANILNVNNTKFDTGFIAIGSNENTAGAIFNINRSLFMPNNTDWTILAANSGGMTFNLTNSAFLNDEREAIVAATNKANTFNVKHCTFADLPGSTAVTHSIVMFLLSGNNTANGASSFTLQNNIFSHPNDSYAVIFNDPGDPLAILPTLTVGTNLWNIGSLRDGDAAQNAPGSVIITGDPQFLADGFHIAEGSPAADAGAAIGITVDYDGEVRPRGVASDLGVDETAPPPTGAGHWTIY